MNIVNKDDHFLTLGWMGTKLTPQKTAVSFIVKATFSLHPDKPASPIEKEPDLVSGDIYYDEDDSKSIYYPSDFAPFKPKTDVIVVGKCHAPKGTEVPAREASFQVGSIKKTLKVFGDRYWKKGFLGYIATDPEPFTEIDLCYENSFGGHGYKKNPVGKGTGKLATKDGIKLHPLPNIVHANEQILSSKSRPDPAGFGALHQTWQQRMALVGTYGKDYVKKRWPCFPEDFDWGFFNSAPGDQQVEGYLRGDESLSFYNLHPEYPGYHSSLPGLRALCFLEEIGSHDQPGNLRRVPLNLDTAWIDMEKEKLVLVWRGLTKVQSTKLKEFSSVFILTEPLSEPDHDIRHYQALIQEAIARDDAEFEIEERPSGDIDEIMKKEMAELDAEVAQAEKEFADLEAKASEEEAKHMQMIREQMGDDAPLLDKVLNQPPANDIPLSASMPHIEAVRAERPDLAAQWEESIKESKTVEQEMAAMDAEAAEFEASMERKPDLTREDVIAKAKSGEGLENADLSELDLSNLDLSGVNLAGASLKKVDLNETHLSGANLKGADLSKSNLSGAILEGAVLDDVSFWKAKCEGTIFNKVSIKGADFSGLDLKGVNFSEAHGENADFSGSDLTAAVFTGAKLPRSDFDGCHLAGADFSDAEIKDADFANVQARGINLERADITGLRSGEASDFRQANIRFAKATGSMWEGCVLDNSDFSQALLTGAQFVDTSMIAAKLDRVVADGANFEDANLQQGWLTYANFVRASFERTNLRNAMLHGSNMYEAGFLDVIIEGADFSAANLKGTLLA